MVLNTRGLRNMQIRQHDPTDIIPVEVAGTLDGLFRERVRRSPQNVAYRDYDRSSGKWRDLTWSQMDERIAHWQAAFSREGLASGDRVAVMLRNCPEWVMFEQAAMRLGLVVVPLYTADRPENAVYILRHAGAKVLLLEELAQWQAFSEVRDQMNELVRVIMIQGGPDKADDDRVLALHDWLPERGGQQRPGETREMGDTEKVATEETPTEEVSRFTRDPHQLATIIYTSGTS